MCFLKAKIIQQDSSPKLSQNIGYLENTRDVHDFYQFDQNQNSMDFLGKGISGEVYRAIKNNTQEIYAIKVIQKKNAEGELLKIFKEGQLLSSMDHPNIVKFYERFENSMKIYLVLEYCKGKQIFDVIEKKGKLTQSDAQIVIERIASALTYTHSLNIIHRDIKLNNIMINDTDKELSVKLIDFGFATYINKAQKLKASVGTAFYIAPEVIFGSYDKSADLWSLGIVLYILLMGYPPFVEQTEEQIIDLISHSNYEFEIDPEEQISEGALDLLKRLLTRPKLRISAAEVLNHPWILSRKHQKVESDDSTTNQDSDEQLE